MNLESVKKEIQRLPYQSILKDPDTSEQFAKLYYKIFPDEHICTTCPGVLASAYEKILNFKITTNMKTPKAGKYVIREGATVDMGYTTIEGVPQHITSKNLTDEIAEKILKSNPNFKNQITRSVEDSDLETVTPKRSRKAEIEDQPADMFEVQTETEGGAVVSDDVEQIKNENTRAELVEKVKKLAKKNSEIQFDPAANKDALAEIIVQYGNQ